MWALFLKAVPFRDCVYAAAAIAAVVWYNVHVHNLEVGYSQKRVAAVNSAYADASAQALKAAKAAADAKDKQYAQIVAQVKASYEDQIARGNAAHDADIARLRQRAADSRSQHPDAVLGSAAGSSSTVDGGDSGASRLGSVPASLGLELADALRKDDAALAACYADRDGLTGK